MNHRLISLPRWAARRTSRTSPATGARALVPWLFVLFAAGLWILLVVPPLLSAVLAVAAAVVWCIWLEKGPSGSEANPAGSAH